VNKDIIAFMRSLINRCEPNLHSDDLLELAALAEKIGLDKKERAEAKAKAIEKKALGTSTYTALSGAFQQACIKCFYGKLPLPTVFSSRHQNLLLCTSELSHAV